MERRAREAELMAISIVEDHERRSEYLKDELIKAKVAEKAAKDKLFEMSQNSSYNISQHDLQNISQITQQDVQNISGMSQHDLHTFSAYSVSQEELLKLQYSDIYASSSPLSYNGLSRELSELQMEAELSAVDMSVNTDMIPTADMGQLSIEIEKERVEYMQKSKHLHDQLKELKSEIEVLKVEDKQTDLDRLHEEKAHNGESKFTTLRKIKAGTTQARVAFFEEL